MLARTRGQQATPTSFGLKVAGWLAPLDRHLHRLRVLEGNLQVLTFGGAAGNLSALGGSASQNRAAAPAAALAEALYLAQPPMPWHNQPDTPVELGNWLRLVARRPRTPHDFGRPWRRARVVTN